MSAMPDELGPVVLQVTGKTIKARGINVESRITDGTIDRTMDGASTLEITIDDPDRDMLRSGRSDNQIDLQIDGLWWRLVKVSKQGDTLILTFEDRAVAYLRKHTSRARRRGAR